MTTNKELIDRLYHLSNTLLRRDQNLATATIQDAIAALEAADAKWEKVSRENAALRGQLLAQPAVAPDKANPAETVMERHSHLSKFYQVENYADMVDKMETQIDRLQKRTNSLYTQSALTKVREG